MKLKKNNSSSLKTNSKKKTKWFENMKHFQIEQNHVRNEVPCSTVNTKEINQTAINQRVTKYQAKNYKAD